jgi:hypothetical protein
MITPRHLLHPPMPHQYPLRHSHSLLRPMVPQLLPLFSKAVVDKEMESDDSGNSVFSIQLKKLYRALSSLETKIKQEERFVGSLMEDGDAGMNGEVMLGGKEKGLITKGKGREMTVPYVEPGEVERECFRRFRATQTNPPRVKKKPRPLQTARNH